MSHVASVKDAVMASDATAFLAWWQEWTEVTGQTPLLAGAALDGGSPDLPDLPVDGADEAVAMGPENPFPPPAARPALLALAAPEAGPDLKTMATHQKWFYAVESYKQLQRLTAASPALSPASHLLRRRPTASFGSHVRSRSRSRSHTKHQSAFAAAALPHAESAETLHAGLPGAAHRGPGLALGMALGLAPNAGLDHVAPAFLTPAELDRDDLSAADPGSALLQTASPAFWASRPAAEHAHAASDSLTQAEVDYHLAMSYAHDAAAQTRAAGLVFEPVASPDAVLATVVRYAARAMTLETTAAALQARLDAAEARLRARDMYLGETIKTMSRDSQSQAHARFLLEAANEALTVRIRELDDHVDGLRATVAQLTQQRSQRPSQAGDDAASDAPKHSADLDRRDGSRTSDTGTRHSIGTDRSSSSLGVTERLLRDMGWQEAVAHGWPAHAFHGPDGGDGRRDMSIQTDVGTTLSAFTNTSLTTGVTAVNAPPDPATSPVDSEITLTLRPGGDPTVVGRLTLQLADAANLAHAQKAQFDALAAELAAVRQRESALLAHLQQAGVALPPSVSAAAAASPVAMPAAAQAAEQADKAAAGDGAAASAPSAAVPPRRARPPRGHAEPDPSAAAPAPALTPLMTPPATPGLLAGHGATRPRSPSDDGAARPHDALLVSPTLSPAAPDPRHARGLHASKPLLPEAFSPTAAAATPALSERPQPPDAELASPAAAAAAAAAPAAASSSPLTPSHGGHPFVAAAAGPPLSGASSGTPSPASPPPLPSPTGAAAAPMAHPAPAALRSEAATPPGRMSRRSLAAWFSSASPHPARLAAAQASATMTGGGSPGTPSPRSEAMPVDPPSPSPSTAPSMAPSTASTADTKGRAAYFSTKRRVFGGRLSGGRFSSGSTSSRGSTSGSGTDSGSPTASIAMPRGSFGPEPAGRKEADASAAFISAFAEGGTDTASLKSTMSRSSRFSRLSRASGFGLGGRSSDRRSSSGSDSTRRPSGGNARFSRTALATAMPHVYPACDVGAVGSAVGLAPAPANSFAVPRSPDRASFTLRTVPLPDPRT
ncbi:hypothetical protein CXG81DRAFT_17659 [Caulochytrium protostelioides]|uniref:Uncharacterized protein n=1 Tax=Caulochytrium protostelioides TaxID=1555241 RepID=A0A4V1IV36_9FUNG|nr:hypothetical protein CXG81DRAFT_17659 [Caulochytrium protostelioides]|eukprot:RKP02689.1 hypothetical protein CXG81DRAFT_17659 [Caulochytrium protostelioides]